MQSTEPEKAHQNRAGYINKIPVKNLWLLMLYASDLFRHAEQANIAIEDNPEDIPDLIAEILTSLVEQRLRRNLSYGYQSRDAVISRVRGRIDHLYTERHRLLEKGKVACNFDELTINTTRNRFVKAALDHLSTVVKRPLAHRCSTLSNSLYRMGVIGIKPEKREISMDRFGRHDVEDRQMVTAAHLAFNLSIPTESDGLHTLFSPDKNIHWLRKLYEKAVAGFYDVVLPKSEWSVRAGKTMQWQASHPSDGALDILPSMKTDIELDNHNVQRRIIIDTKFNSVVSKGQYGKETLRSGYIYQMYAYLRSQEGTGDPLSEYAEGILLHPTIDKVVKESVTIQGHKIQFATVDLSASATKIREQLLDVVGV